MSDDHGNDGRGPLERAYDTEVIPLMREVRRLCKVHGIRMVAGFDLDRTTDTGEPLLASCNTVPRHDLDNASERLRAAVVSFTNRGPDASAAIVVVVTR